MSLGNDLTPVVREESILNGGDITPATRLEYFLAKAAEGGGGGGGGSVYSPVLAQTTKSVSSGWVSSFSGGPILEDANYRVIVNGTTYEPLTGTAGEDGYICLGNTYVDDSDPSGDYGFGIFYKEGQLSAWLETGESMTMQIDQIIQAIPVPTPAAADTGKVLTADNGGVKWAEGGGEALPAYTNADIGKVLSVVDNGESSATVDWITNLPPYIDFAVTLYYDDEDNLQSTLSVSDFIALNKNRGSCLVIDPDGYMDVQTYDTMRSGLTIIGYYIWSGVITASLHYPTDNNDPITSSVIAVDNNGVTINNYTLKADTSTGALTWDPIIL